jgi:hypothetical protein
MDNVRAKLAEEEVQSFHVALPRFLWRFLPGIHIAPMVQAWQKGKGCLCVDPSSKISYTDDGAANDSIPSPGLDGREDECPSIYYSTALHRHLTQIWNLCIMYPDEDILQYCDDIQAAFHRVLYHPDAMIVFASVLQEFLIIPVSSIFEAHNSPSFFTLLSEGQSHVASKLIFLFCMCTFPRIKTLSVLGSLDSLGTDYVHIQQMMEGSEDLCICLFIWPSCQ